MSQVKIRTAESDTEVAEAFTHKRTKADRKRRTCDSCGKGIRMRQEFVTMPEGGHKHFQCAGLDGDLQACTGCFMLPADCIC